MKEKRFDGKQHDVKGSTFDLHRYLSGKFEIFLSSLKALVPLMGKRQ